MKKLVVATMLVVILLAVAASAAPINTRGLLCPACKIIIDYGAVSAAASGLQAVCASKRCRGAAANLALVAKFACATPRSARSPPRRSAKRSSTGCTSSGRTRATARWR